MIFGFNTDVKYAETVYHVQSEARESDLVLQTQVFVRGRCIGKRTTSYADKATQPGFSEELTHELLKEQHRSVLDAIREGQIDTFLAPKNAIKDAGGHGLGLEWLNAGAAFTNRDLRLSFRVTYEGKPVEGAHLTSRLALSNEAPVHSAVVTGVEGTGEISIRFEDPSLRELAILVQATHADKSASRKFRLRKSGD